MPAEAKAGSGDIPPRTTKDVVALLGGGNQVVHLVCLHCNRSNAVGARYCVECGAGLLRKFCGSCHEVNDAQSRFCQSCGHELPESPESVLPAMPAAASVSEPIVAPGLADLVAANPHEPRHLFDEPTSFDSRSIVVMEEGAAPTAALELARETGQPRRAAYRSPVMVGTGAVMAVGMAFLLWPRSEPPTAAPKAGAVVPTAQAPAASGPGTAVVAASPTQTQAAGLAAIQDPVVAPTEAVAAPLQRVSREAGRPLARRTTAQGPSAEGEGGLARPAAPPPPPKPALPNECTPAMDALALCAPGAKVTGR